MSGLAQAAPAADAVHPPVIPEIAQEMVLSRYTIKSQVNATYRKLGASSRS